MAKDTRGLSSANLGPVTLSRDTDVSTPLMLPEDIRGALINVASDTELNRIDGRKLDQNMIIYRTDRNRYERLSGGSRNASGFWTGGTWVVFNSGSGGGGGNYSEGYGISIDTDSEISVDTDVIASRTYVTTAIADIADSETQYWVGHGLTAGTTSDSDGALAGPGGTSNGVNAQSWGHNTVANGPGANTQAYGIDVETRGTNSAAIGRDLYTNGTNVGNVGASNTLYANNSFAIGSGNTIGDSDNTVELVEILGANNNADSDRVTIVGSNNNTAGTNVRVYGNSNNHYGSSGSSIGIDNTVGTTSRPVSNVGVIGQGNDIYAAGAVVGVSNYVDSEAGGVALYGNSNEIYDSDAIIYGSRNEIHAPNVSVFGRDSNIHRQGWYAGWVLTDSDATQANTARNIGIGVNNSGRSSNDLQGEERQEAVNFRGAVSDSIAIGPGAQVGRAGQTVEEAIAIGHGAHAEYDNSGAIGSGAVAERANQLMLGGLGADSLFMRPAMPGGLVGFESNRNDLTSFGRMQDYVAAHLEDSEHRFTRDSDGLVPHPGSGSDDRIMTSTGEWIHVHSEAIGIGSVGLINLRGDSDGVAIGHPTHHDRLPVLSSDLHGLGFSSRRQAQNYDNANNRFVNSGFSYSGAGAISQIAPVMKVNFGNRSTGGLGDAVTIVYKRPSSTGGVDSEVRLNVQPDGTPAQGQIYDAFLNHLQADTEAYTVLSSDRPNGYVRWQDNGAGYVAATEPVSVTGGYQPTPVVSRTLNHGRAAVDSEVINIGLDVVNYNDTDFVVSATDSEIRLGSHWRNLINAHEDSIESLDSEVVGIESTLQRLEVDIAEKVAGISLDTAYAAAPQHFTALNYTPSSSDTDSEDRLSFTTLGADSESWINLANLFTNGLTGPGTADFDINLWNSTRNAMERHTFEIEIPDDGEITYTAGTNIFSFAKCAITYGGVGSNTLTNRLAIANSNGGYLSRFKLYDSSDNLLINTDHIEDLSNTPHIYREVTNGQTLVYDAANDRWNYGSPSATVDLSGIDSDLGVDMRIIDRQRQFVLGYDTEILVSTGTGQEWVYTFAFTSATITNPGFTLANPSGGSVISVASTGNYTGAAALALALQTAIRDNTEANTHYIATASAGSLSITRRALGPATDGDVVFNASGSPYSGSDPLVTRAVTIGTPRQTETQAAATNTMHITGIAEEYHRTANRYVPDDIVWVEHDDYARPYLCVRGVNSDTLPVTPASNNFLPLGENPDDLLNHENLLNEFETGHFGFYSDSDTGEIHFAEFIDSDTHHDGQGAKYALRIATPPPGGIDTDTFSFDLETGLNTVVTVSVTRSGGWSDNVIYSTLKEDITAAIGARSEFTNARFTNDFAPIYFELAHQGIAEGQTRYYTTSTQGNVRFRVDRVAQGIDSENDVRHLVNNVFTVPSADKIVTAEQIVNRVDNGNDTNYIQHTGRGATEGILVSVFVNSEPQTWTKVVNRSSTGAFLSYTYHDADLTSAVQSRTSNTTILTQNRRATRAYNSSTRLWTIT